MKKTLTLAPGAVIEPIGDDVMVMMPGNTDILRISGPAADTLRTIVAGQAIDPSTPTVRELADQGIIQASGMSRRGLIRAGAIGAGAGIAVLAMPTAAMASSELPSFDVTGTYEFKSSSSDWQFRILIDDLSVAQRAHFLDIDNFIDIEGSSLTIGGTTKNMPGAGTRTGAWWSFAGDASAYTGVVIGTFQGSTGPSYTVGFFAGDTNIDPM